MELATGGSLRSFLDSKGVPSLYEQHQLATTIALGMHYLHGLDPPILHHDLKSDNILLVIKEDGTHESKICDFGMATGANLTKMTTQAAGRAGTQMYKAPECFDDVFVAASDVYAFGRTVEAVRGKPARKPEPQNPQIQNPKIPKSVNPEILNSKSPKA